MNIVHQLRSKDGDEKMEDLYAHVHWLEFYDRPNRTKEELWEMWDREPHWFPRAFKSHAAPPMLPFDDRVRYVVVVRDPRDALMSFLHFVHKHTDKLMVDWQLQGAFRDLLRPPNGVRDLFEGFARRGEHFVGFLKSWWQLKERANVLLLHYADMKRDHMGSIRKIHEFLGMDLTEPQLENVGRLTSFEYMKAHGEKFTVPKLLPGGLESDGMVRKGAVGSHVEEGLPADIERELKELVMKELTPEAAKWIYAGGSY